MTLRRTCKVHETLESKTSVRLKRSIHSLSLFLFFSFSFSIKVHASARSDGDGDGGGGASVPCEEDVHSPAFAAYFSGDASVVPGMETWATPYALSIMGQRQVSNCPFGNGNGYGDGRAVSVGEVVVNGRRWEMQLKGGGPTPFCRGADGRAVLRSSIREFLASEAMHNLNVSTTRALSLVVSQGGDVVRRPWWGP